MGATDLIFKLRNEGYSIKADGSYLDISPADNLPSKLVRQLKHSKAEILTELQQEAQRETRRLRALETLDENSNVPRAIYIDTESDQHNIILTIAIRDTNTFEMLIDKTKYDPWKLIVMMDSMNALH